MRTCASLLLALNLISLASTDVCAASETTSRVVQSSARPDLVALAAKEAENWDDRTTKELESRRGALLKATAELQQYLSNQGANGQKWQTYLRLGEVANAVERDDQSRLEEVADRFASKHKGLELRRFAAVRGRLEDYLATLTLASDMESQSRLKQQVLRLASTLERHTVGPTADSANELGTIVSELQGVHHLTPLISSIRQSNSYPNLYIRLSDDVLSSAIGDPIDRTQPVTDCILGTYITGVARTCAITGVQLIPSRDQAMFDITLSGVANSRTVGRNGPATVHSRGRTSLSGRKRTIFNESGLRDLPATAEAGTRTTLTSISVNRGGLLGGIIQGIAERRAYQTKPQAEAIAGQRAEARLRRELDAQAAEATARANRDYRERFVNRLKEENAYPALLKFSTTRDFLLVKALQANQAQIGAPTGPVPVSGQPDLVVQAHQSMVNNLATSMLAGKTLTDDELRERLAGWLGEVPEEFRLDPEEEPWSITFANEQPVMVEFARGGFQILIQGEGFTSGDRRFPAMNITANYKLVPGDEFRAQRQGELQIFPPDFDPEGDETLSLRQQSLRRLLERRFGKIFTPEIVGEGLVLPGRLSRAGRLRLSHAESRAGWMALGWVRPSRGHRTIAAR